MDSEVAGAGRPRASTSGWISRLGAGLRAASRRDLWAMIAVTLLGVALRVIRLEFQPLWWDEGYSVWFATQSLGRMVELTAQDIHPPFYYALLHGWIALLGSGPVTLRLFSAIVGALAIPAIFWAGRRIVTRRAGLLAALLLAINPFHIYYSQEVRMYGLVALLAVGTLTSAWVAISGVRPLRPRALLLYLLFATAALYTQYYFAFLLLGLFLYVSWRLRRRGRALAYWLALHAALAALYLPWLLYAGPKLVPYVSQKVVLDADRPLGLVSYLARHLSAFLVGHLEGAPAPYWAWSLLLLLPIGFGLALCVRSRIGRACSGKAIALFGSTLLTALLLGWGLGLRFPFFPERGERLLLFALPGFILLLAAAIEALWVWRRPAGLMTLAMAGALACVALPGFYDTQRYATDDYRPLIARSVEQGLPEDTVLCVYPWQVGYWRAYGHPEGPTAILLPGGAWTEESPAVIDEALTRGRVWFPAHLSLGGGLERRVEEQLATRAAPFVNAWYGPGTRLSAWFDFGRTQPMASQDLMFDVPGSGIVTLDSVASVTAPLTAANSVLPVALRWRAAETPPALDVSLRLTDVLNQTWAQHDYEPLGGLASISEGYGLEQESPVRGASVTGWLGEDRLGLLIPAGTPPGRYTLEVTVSLAGAARPLPAQTSGEAGQAGVSGGRLFEVTVLPSDRVLGPERLAIEHRAELQLSGGLLFLGYSKGSGPAAPGELRKFSLFWQASSTPPQDYTAFVQLLDDSGAVLAGWEAPPGAAFATSRWRPGTLMRTQAALRPPAVLSTGSYRLVAGLFDPVSGQRLATPDGDLIELGRLQVLSRARQVSPPSPDQPADVRFGDVATLVGYETIPVDQAVARGGILPVQLVWRAESTPSIAYTVFVHLVDGAGQTCGFGDSEPGDGSLPTTGWLPGEYLVDVHAVQVNHDASPGAYRIAIGLYDPASGRRLALPDGSEQWILPGPIAVR